MKLRHLFSRALLRPLRTLPAALLARGVNARSDVASGRIVFDLTTTAFWCGPPAGIVRVESEFAAWALAGLKNAEFAFFDPWSRSLCQLEQSLATRLMSQDVIDSEFDTDVVFDLSRKKNRKSDRIPGAIRPLAMWVLQSRRKSLQALERIRLIMPGSKLAEAADRLQRAIMNEKYRLIMFNADGSRRACYPVDLVRGPPVEFTSRDILVCAGASWIYQGFDALAAHKRQIGFQVVLYCHDMIPLLFPHFYPSDLTVAHRRYVEVGFPLADLVVFSSRSAEADARNYCDQRGIALGATAISPLGTTTITSEASLPLPTGIEPARFALFVSTIEPRKGHAMIYKVWRDLLAAGVPQKAGFKLVFAGRKGWMADNLMRVLAEDTSGTVRIINNADDATVATLYRNAAFCLYPSVYEGYGLPVIEAFSYGKATLASTGGALPEVVGDFSPCLDPDDAEAWRGILQAWIEEPAAREAYEQKIQTSFKHPSWPELAQAFFALVQGVKRR